MTENNFSMKSFFHSIYLNKPVNEVYKYAATASGFEKWFIGNAVFTAPSGIVRKPGETASADDMYNFKWLAKDYSVSGKVLETKINSLFRFTFGSLFIVTITVKEDKGKTLLTLHQQYAEEAAANDFAHINCCVCWIFFLTNLKSVLEHKADLRETESDNPSLLNR